MESIEFWTKFITKCQLYQKDNFQYDTEQKYFVSPRKLEEQLDRRILGKDI